MKKVANYYLAERTADVKNAFIYCVTTDEGGKYVWLVQTPTDAINEPKMVGMVSTESNRGLTVWHFRLSRAALKVFISNSDFIRYSEDQIKKDFPKLKLM